MNFLSLNVKGAADSRKEKWVREIRKDNGINFICIQETSLEDGSKIRFDQFWGKGGFDKEWVNACGRSGGLFSIWDTNCFVKQQVIKDRNFLLIYGMTVGDYTPLTIVNVYGPQNRSDKINLWNKLTIVKDKFDGNWIFIGDFNEVRFPEDRFNSIFNHNGAQIFNEFIYNAGLMEYAMGRKKFTFRAGNSQKLSKIDRALVCESFWNKWPEASFSALDMGISDHCPIILITDARNFGPRPFKFFDSWLSHPELPDVVNIGCKGALTKGVPSKILAFKLKGMKQAIKDWMYEVKRRQNEQIVVAKGKVSDYEALMENRILTEQELNHELECRMLLNKLESDRVMDLKQQARIKWAVEGDENSAFFHGFIKNRICKSRINGLVIDNEWCTIPGRIKQEAQAHFARRFCEPIKRRPTFKCDGINRLQDEDRDKLVEPFTREEVLNAIKECDGSRAPGPDGFNFNFIKRFWTLLEKDFMDLMHQFHSDGFIHKGMSSSFITLIPKINDPNGLNDFRPISLLGCISKLISKILANRLRKVINHIVSDVQTGFIAGRNILDGPLIINEVMGWVKKSKKKTLLFKIDFEKAFDSINWEFVDTIMGYMNFSGKWRMWIRGVLSSARASVLINGSPSKEFQYERGVRQGDPLSPFIFIIAMEAFTYFMSKGCELEMFKGLQTPKKGPMLSHLMYADDVMVIGEWSKNNVNFLARFLRSFNLVSGLKINFHKSSLYGICCNESEVSEVALDLGCKVGKIPFIHLGLMIGANMKIAKNWKPVIDLVEARLSLWKANTLSIGGRVTLIKSVFESLPVFYFSLYKAPLCIIRKLDCLRRRFLWGGSKDDKGISWVAWDKVTRPKNKGGLGLTDLNDFNTSLLTKWHWRFRNEEGRLWRRCIKALHETQCMGKAIPCKLMASGNWKTICSVDNSFNAKGININDCFHGRIGNGESLRFWLDNWTGHGQLCRLFPSLFKLEAAKNTNVASRISNRGEFKWRWKGADWSQEAIDDLVKLYNLDIQVNFKDTQDKWEWGLKGANAFSVSSARCLLSSYTMAEDEVTFPWINILPKKISIFGWRLLLNRLPTKDLLMQRGLHIADPDCVFCGDSVESLDHLMTGCRITRELWDKIEEWCKFKPMIIFSVKDLIFYHISLNGSKARKNIIQSVIMVACWVIWKARNGMIFNGSKVNVGGMLKEIKSMGFLWIKNRFSKWSLEEHKWLDFSID